MGLRTGFLFITSGHVLNAVKNRAVRGTTVPTAAQICEKQKGGKMADYIERDAAIDAVRKYCNEECYYMTHEGKCLAECSTNIGAKRLKRVPVADVVERKKGTWIEGGTYVWCGMHRRFPLACSCCGKTALDEPWYFCPNCGADMRGDDDG